MADKKISELTTASTLTGAEQIPLVQTTTTKKTTVADITNKLIVVSKTTSASAQGYRLQIWVQNWQEGCAFRKL